MARRTPARVDHISNGKHHNQIRSSASPAGFADVAADAVLDIVAPSPRVVTTPGTRVRIVVLVGILAASACAANAQDFSGNSEAGRVYAREVCSPCHAVTAEQAAQRTIAIAPDFQTIANTPGLTATALRAFLQTPHPKMPNLILSPEQSADVIAFLLSLRERSPETKP